MNRRITVNKKLISSIKGILTKRISLNDLDEFVEYDGSPLFVDPPEQWGDLENAIFDYQERLYQELLGDIKVLLKIDETDD